MVGPTTLHEGQVEVVKRASRGFVAVALREIYVVRVSELRTLRPMEIVSQRGRDSRCCAGKHEEKAFERNGRRVGENIPTNRRCDYGLVDLPSRCRNTAIHAKHAR